MQAGIDRATSGTAFLSATAATEAAVLASTAALAAAMRNILHTHDERRVVRRADLHPAGHEKLGGLLKRLDRIVHPNSRPAGRRLLPCPIRGREPVRCGHDA